MLRALLLSKMRLRILHGPEDAPEGDHIERRQRDWQLELLLSRKPLDINASRTQPEKGCWNVYISQLDQLD